eukprot:m.574558 g.574558  ORF g.574558 m.574558 type:complete len:95 (-) comp22280_c0_seq1:74-358(-)
MRTTGSIDQPSFCTVVAAYFGAVRAYMSSARSMKAYHTFEHVAESSQIHCDSLSNEDEDLEKIQTITVQIELRQAVSHLGSKKPCSERDNGSRT